FYERYESLKSMLPEFFEFQGSGPEKTQTRFSSVGTFSDFTAFTGNVTYDDIYQGYDTIVTPLEFIKGFQIERKLHDDDLTNIMDQRPRGLATAAQRTRETHGARIFNNAFAVDTYFYNNSEGVSLCSDAHTTTSGASTATGFDNRSTAGLSAAAVAANRISMVDFRGDRAERISVMPGAMMFSPNLFETAYEIVSSMGKVDVADNNANVHYGQYTLYEWNYLTDTNNWFMFDRDLMKDNLPWIDLVDLEFGWVEDFETLYAKYRAYMRYANGWLDWRWILGNQVS
ncbi:MAG: hypothetical protein Q7J84_14285, partial [Sulfuricaulis sp.]|nr:hypothetical protein [Sulfuricaulis sp.]